MGIGSLPGESSAPSTFSDCQLGIQVALPNLSGKIYCWYWILCAFLSSFLQQLFLLLYGNSYKFLFFINYVKKIETISLLLFNIAHSKSLTFAKHLMFLKCSYQR